jgi:hypothetical protein
MQTIAAAMRSLKTTMLIVFIKRVKLIVSELEGCLVLLQR